MAPSGPSVTTTISTSAPSRSAAFSGGLLAGDQERLAAVDEQRAGAVEVARRVGGEGARVVVAAGRVAARAGRHEVELVERDDDRARVEAGDLGARSCCASGS